MVPEGSKMEAPSPPNGYREELRRAGGKGVALKTKLHELSNPARAEHDDGSGRSLPSEYPTSSSASA